MLHSPRRAKSLLAVIAALGCFSFPQSAVWAEQPADAGAAPPSAQQLIEALTSKSARGLAPAGAEAASKMEAEDKLIQNLASKAARGLSVSERTTLAEAVKERPKFDMEVTFEFNSANIAEAAKPALMALGKAMQSEDLKTAKFLVAGHTDAKGKQVYNQKLSEMRAASVKAFLMSNFQLTDEKMVTVGYGRERLKNTSNPIAQENRRVQVVNISPSMASAKP